jgi:hypothetical protein
MQMLTNVCIYWFNANITSSMRLYKEAGGDLKELLGLKVLVSANLQLQPLCGLLRGCCWSASGQASPGPVQCHCSAPLCTL